MIATPGRPEGCCSQWVLRSLSGRWWKQKTDSRFPMHPWLNATNSAHFQEPGKEKEKETVSALKGLLGLSRQNLALTHFRLRERTEKGGGVVLRQR